MKGIAGRLVKLLWLLPVALPLHAAAETVEYFHTDALGTPIAVTDASGNLIEASEYEPYGKLLNRPLTDGPGFTGHVQDTATGLTYMQQRYYDPVIGRFLSLDPVRADSISGSNFNRYWYGNNNPYKFLDPDGRCVGSRISTEDGKCPSGGYTTQIKADANNINDGGRKFQEGTEQKRYDAASYVVNRVRTTVENKDNQSPDASAKYFSKVFQPASTKFGVEISANIVKENDGSWRLRDIDVGSVFRRIDGIGFMAPGGTIGGGFNVHSHPLEDMGRGWNSPFSSDDIKYLRNQDATGYLSTPSMRVYKSESGGWVEEVK
jgi:RHS repeat-associated protein